MELLLRSTWSSEVELEMLWSATTATSSSPPEELIEQVIMIEATPWVLPLFFILDSLLSILIIDSSLVWVSKGLIGISDLLELDLGLLWVVLVLIWMELDGLLFKCLLDLCICGCLLNAQGLVIVLTQGQLDQAG